MAAWMLYVMLVAGALGLAGWLAEGGLRRLGRPVRWVWVAVLVGTISLPVALPLLVGAGSSGAGGGFVGRVLWSAMPAPVASSTVDVVLLVAWAVGTLVLLASLRLSAWTLRRNERSWRSRWVDGHRVLVSRGFGPGVIGAARPRMVLPDWLLEAGGPLRRLIVLHELEHVRAGDTRLMHGGLMLALLVPWCVPVWWQLHRLSAAIETDCDARVLAGTASPGDYARALVAVARRPTRGSLAVPAFAPGTGELERRIRLITRPGRPPSGRTGLAFLATALLVVLALGVVPAPDPPSLRSSLRPVASARITTDAPRSATVILSVFGDEGGR